MHARSALFDVYGDHLRRRGGVAPVAALARLLAPLGISVPAVRTAVSRMVRQGWLEPVATPDGAGYQLTDRAERRLDAAHARIYRTPHADWDGHWHLIALDRPGGRASRDRLEGALRLLGYAPLHAGVWVAPRRSLDLPGTLAAEGLEAHAFSARLDGDAGAVVERAWDLGPVAQAYTSWTAMARELLDAAGESPDDRQAFAVRSQLVHEWRLFLFTDPALPAELLPPDWPGHDAAALFDEAAARLRPGADAFVDDCLDPSSPPAEETT
ncbi:MAG TPA: PaaX family transcriptional regulator C-terminal domain-containing protein [Actinomycetales bacterium]|nr:PaaX family transcriptional regulator C-terminal domain-containing protein [Actinomycetales bacterium]